MFYFSTNIHTDLTVWERIAAWYEGSVLCELINYITQTYYTVELGAYEHFQFGSNAAESLRGIILALAVALIAASIVAAYTRTWVGAFVRELNKREVHSSERAQTLFELGFFRSVAVRRELKHGLQLRRLVVCRERQEYLESLSSTAENEIRENAQTGDAAIMENSPILDSKQGDVPSNRSQKMIRQNRQNDGFVLDFKTAHFYIPSDLRYLADVRYEKKGSGWIQVVLTAIAAVILSALICRFLPDLIQLADNIISLMSPQ